MSNLDEGEPCDDIVLRYYFNVFRGLCLGFAYKGCEGNDNRYVDEKSCQESCMGKNLILFLLSSARNVVCSFWSQDFNLVRRLDIYMCSVQNM